MARNMAAVSYDIILVADRVSSDADLAWDALRAFRKLDGRPDPRLVTCCENILTRYLQHKTLTGGDTRDTDGSPVRVTFGAKHAVLSIAETQNETLVREAITLAHHEGLVAFDEYMGQLHRGDGFIGVELGVEGRPYLMAPRFDQVETAIEELTPDSGPSFLHLTREDADYAQIAGGDGHFALEWREYTGRRFRHWAAGYPDEEVSGIISVLTNEAQVPVRSNENMSMSDVKAVLHAFLIGAGRPQAYAWRDMTDQFT